MENITLEYLSRAEISLFITILAYFLMNGAGIFETIVLVPKWTTSPPESFQMLKGEYGLDLKTFWIVMHSAHEVTFILSIIACWKLDPIRNWLLALFAIHFAIRVWTIVYFAPVIMEFQKTETASIHKSDLLIRARRWKNLNYLRTGLFIAVSTGLIPVYHKLQVAVDFSERIVNSIK